MENLGLIQAMTVIQNHVATEVENEEVRDAWDVIKEQVTQMIGTMVTMRQILEADHTVEDISDELSTREKHDSK